MDNFRQPYLIIRKTLYGHIKGSPIYSIELKNKNISVGITNIGCAITSICTPDKNGFQKNIVAGFKDLKDYKQNEFYFGCVLGRYANRLANGRFNLDGREIQLSVNDGINHLHGGIKGFNKKIWQMDNIINNENEIGVEFNYVSRDGEEGYPGNLSIKVKYTLNEENQLSINYFAETDKPTPVNLSNHTYFNLTGFEDNILNHDLQIASHFYTEKNINNVPTGNVLSLSDTPLDFIKQKKIGENINALITDKGFDHNYILKENVGKEIEWAAQLSEKKTGRIVNVYTNQPAIQLYTANFWNGSVIGQQNKPYLKHGSVALETQSFPDSPNHPNFPNTILYPDDIYSSTTIYEFKVAAE